MDYGGGGGGRRFRQPQTFDGKRHRKAVTRRTIDWNTPLARFVESRFAVRDFRDRPALQFTRDYASELPAAVANENPVTSVTTRFVHSSTNKESCPVNSVCWTPSGKRLLAGSAQGEFTLWNALTFNFETIQQAHESAIRDMKWTHNEDFMISCDQMGGIRYWQPNMNEAKRFQGHTETCRAVSISPTDLKFTSCSDDRTVKVWDFARCAEESVLTGHLWDVKTVDWHPYKGLIASGSKDNLVKLWDPKTGKALTTIDGHKNQVLKVRWNRNGNWLLSGSRDQLIKLFDIRMMKELSAYRGHTREVCAIEWHPVHEDLFVSSGSEGELKFWIAGNEAPVHEINGMHESNVWTMAWHPMGHLLATGSTDHSIKFWTRSRMGEEASEQALQARIEDASVAFSEASKAMPQVQADIGTISIPGLDPSQAENNSALHGGASGGSGRRSDREQSRRGRSSHHVFRSRGRESQRDRGRDRDRDRRDSYSRRDRGRDSRDRGSSYRDRGSDGRDRDRDSDRYASAPPQPVSGRYTSSSRYSSGSQLGGQYAHPATVSHPPDAVPLPLSETPNRYAAIGVQPSAPVSKGYPSYIKK